MKTQKQHWNEIFSTKVDPQLGWFEKDATQTIKFLAMVPQLSEATVFIPGAGTSVLVDELLPRCSHLFLNDISDEALAKLRNRIQGGDKVTSIHHDISKPLGKKGLTADIWVDRAVLHFLLTEEQITGYFDNLRAVVKPGGHILLAEFAPDGAPKCAGLELHRYSVEEMSARLGADFSMVEQERYVFVNPFGEPRPYNYALYLRRSGQPSV